MSWFQSIQKSKGCQKWLKKCSTVVSQLSETLVSFSQENITVKKTRIKRDQKRRLAKEMLEWREQTSNFSGHEGSKYLSMM